MKKVNPRLSQGAKQYIHLHAAKKSQFGLFAAVLGKELEQLLIETVSANAQALIDMITEEVVLELKILIEKFGFNDAIVFIYEEPVKLANGIEVTQKTVHVADKDSPLGKPHIPFNILNFGRKSYVTKRPFRMAGYMGTKTKPRSLELHGKMDFTGIESIYIPVGTKIDKITARRFYTSVSRKVRPKIKSFINALPEQDAKIFKSLVRLKSVGGSLKPNFYVKR